MRNTYIKLLSILLLGFLGASNASGAAATVVMLQTSAANATNQSKNKAMEEGRISCVPQGDPQQQLWTCSDAYGNQYDNLVITLKSEIDRLKNGNLKRARN